LQSAKTRVLVVDDEALLRESVCDYLGCFEFEAISAGTCSQALELIRTMHPQALILDYSLPDGTALEMLPEIRQIEPGLPVIVLTGHCSVQLAVQAIKSGAEQFVTKPVELSALRTILSQVLQQAQSQQERPRPAVSTCKAEERDPFLGSSAAIRTLKKQAERIAGADCSVLLLGETGSGKGVLAKWLHENSRRSSQVFVDLNCAGLSRDLLESELFGHEKGAFTGAVAVKPGLLEYAGQGTLFLDEIGDMDMDVQAKLLKVIEEKKFRRLGDVRDRRTDARLISATHHNITNLVRDKKFRSDLYFRVATVVLRVPPLRERPEDVVPLANCILDKLVQDHVREPYALAPDAVHRLTTYPWPGNIRELRNVLERAILLSSGQEISMRDLQFDTEYSPAILQDESRLTLQELQSVHIKRVLEQEMGHVERAAKRLGIPRSTLYQKIKELGLTV
jgi:DNA-binding NtrC family response regulator